MRKNKRVKIYVQHNFAVTGQAL